MKTGDLVKLLGVSEATIRNWVSEFDEFFSDGAKGIGARHRLYTENDVLVAQTISVLSAGGQNYIEIRKRLRSGERIEQHEIASGINMRLVPEASVRTLVDAAEIKAERDRLQLRVEELENTIERIVREHRDEVKTLHEENRHLQREHKEEITSIQRENAEAMTAMQREMSELQRKLGYLEGRLSEIDKKDI